MAQKEGKRVCLNEETNGSNCPIGEKRTDATYSTTGNNGKEAIMRFWCVSKGWDALTKDPHFIKMHLDRAISSPSRIIVEPWAKDPVASLYLIDRDGDSWRSRKIPIENIPGNYMYSLGTCHGLICVGSSNTDVDPLSIYNPITRECIELPKTDYKTKVPYINVGFGFDPSSKKYKVVRFLKLHHYDGSEYIKGQIISVGEGSWRELEVPYVCSVRKPVFLDGVLYWLIEETCGPNPGEIVFLDLRDEKFSTIKFPPSVIRSIHQHEHLILMNLRGFLSLIDHDNPKRLRFWRIERTDSKRGYEFYHSSYLIPMKHNGINCNCTVDLKDKLIDNSYLFHVIIYWNIRPGYEPEDKLSLYFPETNQYKVLGVHGIPKHFHLNVFVPSLVSPSSDLATDQNKLSPIW